MRKFRDKWPMSGIQKCIFVLMHSKDTDQIFSGIIDFNEEYWEKVFPTLKDFYFGYYFKLIYLIQVHNLPTWFFLNNSKTWQDVSLEELAVTCVNFLVVNLIKSYSTARSSPVKRMTSLPQGTGFLKVYKMTGMQYENKFRPSATNRRQ